MYISSDPIAGQTAVFYNQFSSWSDFFWNTTAVVGGIAQDIIRQINLAYILHPQDTQGYDRGMNKNASPFVFVPSSLNSQFYNIITNSPPTGNIEYYCHASPSSFGAGTGNTATNRFDEDDVAKALGNGIGGAFHHRVRFAWINGCNSAGVNSAGGSLLAFAFGSPYNPSGQLTLSLYMGWDTYFYNSVWCLPPGIPTFCIDNFYLYWTDMGQDNCITVITAADETLDADDPNIRALWPMYFNTTWGTGFGHPSGYSQWLGLGSGGGAAADMTWYQSGL